MIDGFFHIERPVSLDQVLNDTNLLRLARYLGLRDNDANILVDSSSGDGVCPISSWEPHLDPVQAVWVIEKMKDKNFLLQIGVGPNMPYVAQFHKKVQARHHEQPKVIEMEGYGGMCFMAAVTGAAILSLNWAEAMSDD